eukprot:CAMPEP_0115668598 /NCGR_PEP_ID=MMETSP0272-20121206/50556_1 /TAXON_ID=71861 /ORGANISM="Scrippsiella trochoidea, Strain CCMP3099" /LENGTH=93 /DNA_ID=CAMNT_0003107217 /DNA_START=65 /DNA_END=346 /DNA_ORIENTATION=-
MRSMAFSTVLIETSNSCSEMDLTPVAKATIPSQKSSLVSLPLPVVSRKSMTRRISSTVYSTPPLSNILSIQGMSLKTSSFRSALAHQNHASTC